MVEDAYPLSSEFRGDWEQLYATALGPTLFNALDWLEPGYRHFGLVLQDREAPSRWVAQTGPAGASGG